MLSCVEHEKSFITSGPDLREMDALSEEAKLSKWKQIFPFMVRSLFR